MLGARGLPCRWCRPRFVLKAPGFQGVIYIDIQIPRRGASLREINSNYSRIVGHIDLSASLTPSTNTDGQGQQARPHAPSGVPEPAGARGGQRRGHHYHYPQVRPHGRSQRLAGVPPSPTPAQGNEEGGDSGLCHGGGHPGGTGSFTLKSRELSALLGPVPNKE